MICQWDSGSATGCAPACSAPARRTVTHEGYRGPYVSALCDRHAKILPARIYPDRVLADVPLGATSPAL